MRQAARRAATDVLNRRARESTYKVNWLAKAGVGLLLGLELPSLTQWRDELDGAVFL